MDKAVRASRLFIYIISQNINGVCFGGRAVLLPLEVGLDGFGSRS